MTMLTDKEIDSVWERTASDSSYEFARAIIAAYQDKLRQGVELPEPVDEVVVKVLGSVDCVTAASAYYTVDQLLHYGDQRDQAGYLRGLDDVERIAYEPPINGNSIAQARILMAIDKLKGGE